MTGDAPPGAPFLRSNRPTLALLLAIAAALPSCGGSDSPAGQAPLPVATPSPTPAPTSSPTPSPAASYELGFDLSRDRSYPLIGAQLTSTSTNVGTVPTYSAIASDLLDAVINPFATYVAATQQTTLSLANGASTTYERSQLTLQNATALTYSPATGFFTLFQPGPTLGNLPAPLRYVVGIVQNEQIRNAGGGLDNLERRFVGGTATRPEDAPTSGALTYTVLLSTYAQTPLRANSFNRENATMAVDYTARTVRGTILATSTSASEAQSSVELTFDGQLGSGGTSFNGSVTSPDGGSGRFSGRLYGPAAGEIGLALDFTRGSQKLIGTVVGLRR